MNTPLPTQFPTQTHQTHQTKRGLASLGLMALLAIPVILLVAIKRISNTHTLKSGDLIPSLVLRDASSGERSLQGTSHKPSAILFFSVDCPHCQREMTALNEVHKTLWPAVEFVAVSLSDQSKTWDYVQETKTLVRVLIDDKGEARRFFGISEVPTLFLVDENHHIRRLLVGEQTRGAITHQLSLLLGRPTPETPDDDGGHERG